MHLLLDQHYVFTTARDAGFEPWTCVERLPRERGMESEAGWLPSRRTLRLDGHDRAALGEARAPLAADCGAGVRDALDPDGWRAASPLLAEPRFGRVSARAAAWFETDPRAFTQTFRVHHGRASSGWAEAALPGPRSDPGGDGSGSSHGDRNLEARPAV